MTSRKEFSGKELKDMELEDMASHLAAAIRDCCKDENDLDDLVHDAFAKRSANEATNTGNAVWAILAAGYTPARLAQEMGVTLPEAISDLANADDLFCRPDAHDRVVAAFESLGLDESEELWDIYYRLASLDASAINNAGLESQLMALMTLGWDEVALREYLGIPKRG